MSEMPAVTPAPSRLPPRPANKTSVVRGLLAELMKGRWQTTDRLTEAEACERFNVSRTPVREAFFELQGLGLIELRRNCGAIIRPFGHRELRDIYAVRSLLEVEAARLAASRATAEQLDPLVAAFTRIRESGGVDPEWRHDRALHSSIAETSGNPRLASEITRYAILVQAMREIVGEQALGIHATSAEEHLEILQALKSRQPTAAAEAMARHLAQASDSAIAALAAMRNLG